MLDNNCYSSTFPRKYVHTIIIYENMNKYEKCLEESGENTFTIQSNFNIFIPKAICCASVEPFFDEFSQILNFLVDYSLKKSPLVPVEQVIQAICLQLPKPPRGIYQVTSSIFDFKICIQSNGLNRLPDCHFPLHLVFRYFSINQVIFIYKNVLLENKVVFFSKNIRLLNPIIKFFISLLFPFKYPHPVISILPEKLFYVLASITPYVVGVNQEYDRSFEKSEYLAEQSCLLVDIDLALITVKDLEATKMTEEEYGSFSKVEYPDLPEHYHKKLYSKLYSLLSNKNLNEMPKTDKELNYEINDLFFQFLVNIMQGYRKYINFDFFIENDISFPCIEYIYKINEFLTNFSKIDLPFYAKFMRDGQLFCDYIYRCIIPKTIEEKLEMLFFDENLSLKNNRSWFSFSQSTPFLDSKLYQVKEIFQWNFKPQPETNWVADPLAGVISVNNKPFYILFPSLDIDYCRAIKGKLAKNLTKYVSKINWEIAATLIENKQTLSMEKTMKTAIYHSWLLIFAVVFKNIPFKEKVYWFEQMEKIFDLVPLHEVELVNLLFDAIASYGTEWQALDLYDKVVKGKMMTFSIYQTASQILKDKSRAKSIEATSSTRRSSVGSTKVTERSFNCGRENITFQQSFSCPDCNNQFKMTDIFPKFIGCKKENAWFACCKCNKFFYPIVNFNLLKTTENEVDIDSARKLKLLSPFELNSKLQKELSRHAPEGLFHKLESRSPEVFWNAIFYFLIYKLPFELFLGIK